MIRILRAFALFRWRLFVGSLRGRRRDQLEQVSRISRLFVLAVVCTTFVPASILLTFLSFVGGRGIAQGNAKAAALFVGARAILFMVLLFVAISPVLRFGGTASSMTRLALLPIPRRLLFAFEIAAQLADPWVLAIAPPLLALPVGLLAGGAPLGAVWALAAGIAILLALATLGSAASLLGALLFRNRRLGDLAIVVVLVVIMAGAYVPMVFSRHLKELRHGRDGTSTAPFASLTEARWTRALPSELYVRVVEDATGPGPGNPATPLLAIAGFALVFGTAAAWAFGRLLDSPGERRNRSRRAEARIVRLPGVGPAASAIAWTTLRLFARSVRGRVILFTSPIPVLMIGLLWRGRALPPSAAPYAGVMAATMGAAMILLSFQTVFVNQFAVDRAGLTLTFLAPVSERDLIVGKMAGCALAGSMPLIASTVFSAMLQPGGPPLLWAAATVTSVAAFVVEFPFASFLSATFPAAFDLMKLKGGNAHPFASIVGSLATVIALGAGAGVVILAFVLSGSAAVSFLASLVVLALAVVIAAGAIPAVCRVLADRRENLAMVAQGR